MYNLKGNLHTAGSISREGATDKDILIGDGSMKTLDQVAGESNTILVREKLGINQIINGDISKDTKLEDGTYFGDLVNFTTNYAFLWGSSYFPNVDIAMIKQYIDDCKLTSKFYTKVSSVKKLTVPEGNDPKFRSYTVVARQTKLDAATVTKTDIADLLAGTYTNNTIIKIQNGSNLFIFKYLFGNFNIYFWR